MKPTVLTVPLSLDEFEKAKFRVALALRDFPYASEKITS